MPDGISPSTRKPGRRCGRRSPGGRRRPRSSGPAIWCSAWKATASSSSCAQPDRLRARAALCKVADTDVDAPVISNRLHQRTSSLALWTWSAEPSPWVSARRSISDGLRARRRSASTTKPGTPSTFTVRLMPTDVTLAVPNVRVTCREADADSAVVERATTIPSSTSRGRMRRRSAAPSTRGCRRRPNRIRRARGIDGTIYVWGNEAADCRRPMASVAGKSPQESGSPGSSPAMTMIRGDVADGIVSANRFGLYDMAVTSGAGRARSTVRILSIRRWSRRRVRTAAFFAEDHGRPFPRFQASYRVRAILGTRTAITEFRCALTRTPRSAFQERRLRTIVNPLDEVVLEAAGFAAEHLHPIGVLADGGPDLRRHPCDPRAPASCRIRLRPRAPAVAP